jgi:hypothetical protein
MSCNSERPFDRDNLLPVARMNAVTTNMQIPVYSTTGYTDTETLPYNVPQDQPTIFRLPFELILQVGAEIDDHALAQLRCTSHFFSYILETSFYKRVIKACSLPTDSISGERIKDPFPSAMEKDDDETLDTLLQRGLKLDTRLGLYKWTGMDRSLLGFILDEREGPARRRKPLPMKMLRLIIGKGKIDAMEFEAAACSGSTDPVQMMIERSSPDTIHKFISGNEKYSPTE